VFFLERTDRTKVEETLAWKSASSTGGPGPVSRFPQGAVTHPPEAAVCSTPQRVTLSLFGSFQRPKSLPNFGQTSPSPVASTGGRSGQSGTLLETTGGTQTHSRRTGSKLGQLPCARQGLVRVPESNTKYGGNPGITGGRPTLPVPPSISESSGIPKRKKLFAARSFELRPAVHRVTIYCGGRGCLGETHGKLGGVRAGMPAGQWR